MAIKINGTNTTASPGITGPDTDTGLVYGTDEVQVVTGGTTRATVDSSGRVGIGTSPGRTLDVSGSIRSGGSTNPYLALNDNTTEAYFEIASSVTRISSGTSQPLAFRIGSTEAARLDTSGKVGINTTTPFSDAELTVGNGGSGNASIAWRRTGSGENDWALSNQGGELKLLGGGDATTIGGLSEKVRFQSGGGISFNGDTAAANALDDYEEGTWTPVDQQGDAYTISNACSYTKIGNLVFISFDITGTATANGSYVYGLPFNVKINANGGGNYCFYPGYVTGTLNQNLYAHSGQTHIRLYHGTSAISINSNDRLIMSGTYLAA
jgi:hypothetical protein